MSDEAAEARKDFVVRPGGEVSKRPHAHSRGDWRSRSAGNDPGLNSREKAQKEIGQSKITEGFEPDRKIENPLRRDGNEPDYVAEGKAFGQEGQQQSPSLTGPDLKRVEIEERRIKEKINKVKYFGKGK